MSDRGSMRTALAQVVAQLGTDIPELVTVSSDGHLIFDPFIHLFPERHIDVGIAEGTMIGVASGLARAGKIVIVSTIASFLLRRANEQIYLDVSLEGLPVKLLGIGGGLEFGPMGSTHHLPEDIAVMQSRPNMAVFVPADACTAVAALRAAMAHAGPAYIRVGFGEEYHLPKSGDPSILRDGGDVLIISTGACAQEALAAAELLARENLFARVLNVVQIKPWRIDMLREFVLPARPIVVVEEHHVVGGLGSLVADWLVCNANSIRLVRLGLDNRIPPVADRHALMRFFEIDAQSITEAAKRAILLRS